MSNIYIKLQSTTPLAGIALFFFFTKIVFTKYFTYKLLYISCADTVGLILVLV